MSVIVVDNQVVHYEVFGHGRPVLFLHGWLGSWRYWYPTMQVVAEQFRTYSFDFLGFGESRRKTTEESIRTYSQQVIRFMDELGIDRIALVGHSMGGMVAMKTALDYPDRVQCVVTVGAPFDGRSISWLLKLTRNQALASTFARWSWLRRTLFHFFLGQDYNADNGTVAQDVQEVLDESLKSNAETLRATICSMLHTDLRPELPRLNVPALVVHGRRDDVVNPNQVKLFRDIAMADVMVMEKSRHFPFSDEPGAFNDRVLRFLKEMSVPTSSPWNQPRVSDVSAASTSPGLSNNGKPPIASTTAIVPAEPLAPISPSAASSSESFLT
jgi:pimeloyl-ACP methyl ester carboxylesterase